MEHNIDNDDLWDVIIELSPETITTPTKFTSKGQAYFQKKFRMDQDNILLLIKKQWQKECAEAEGVEIIYDNYGIAMNADEAWLRPPLTGPLEIKIYFYLEPEGNKKYPTGIKYLNDLETYIIHLAEGVLFKSKKQIILKQSGKLFANGVVPHINILIRKL